MGSTVNLGDAVTGGTWASSNAAVATAGSSGAILGVSTGTAVITYALGACRATAVVTVNPLPAAITGTPGICAGGEHHACRRDHGRHVGQQQYLDSGSGYVERHCSGPNVRYEHHYL